MKTLLNVRDMLDGLTPMLAETCEQDLTTLVGTHIFDQKVDGVRTLIARHDGELIIRNRNGKDRTDVYPEIEAAATFDLPDGLALDGEIVAASGVFSDIQRRDKQRGASTAALAVEVPAKFVAFDILHHPDEGDVRHLPYEARRRLLEAVVPSTSRFDITLASADPAFYDQIKALGGEGVVAKRLAAPYGIGRKKDWLKFKTTRSVSAIAVKYENGKGSREDTIGALLLAMVNDEGVGAYVGKVGSGLKAEDLTFLKDQMDSGILPIVEVETLGRTKNNLLRQPVFKGVRTDLEAHEVRINQLNALPKG